VSYRRYLNTDSNVHFTYVTVRTNIKRIFADITVAICVRYLPKIERLSSRHETHSMDYTSRATYLQLTYILTAIRIFKMNMGTSTQLTTQTFSTIVRLKHQDVPMVYILIFHKPLLLKTWVLNLAVGVQQAATPVFGLIKNLQLRCKMQCLKKCIDSLIHTQKNSPHNLLEFCTWCTEKETFVTHAE
jgi:hypothetical protein